MPASDDQPDSLELRELRQTAADLGIPCLESVDDACLDAALVSDLPVEWARSNRLLPIRIEGEPCALTAHPRQTEAQATLSLLIGEPLRPVAAPAAVVARCIERCYYRRDRSPGAFLRDLPAPSGAPARPAREQAADLFEVSEQAPVSQLINLILLEALKKNASDIHFEPFSSRMRVRYRVDGVLYEQSAPPKSMEETLVSRLKVMARLDIAEKRLPQDGMARVRVGEREVDVRVSTVPVAEGERVVLRLLDRDSALLPLETLGMAPDMFATFQTLLGQSHGIIVVCGPTGSGKTTTLYAALSQLDASRKNIMTIEEPIEYQLPDIGQIQARPKIGLTFAGGLRHILRQDPDVILVGETRDTETAEIAMRASLTGHLVFTTLHTNDAPGAIARLTDMGADAHLVASCLNASLAQRLVRKLCPACRAPQRPAAAELATLGEWTRPLSGQELQQARGCPLCLEGYKGRVGLFELMRVNEEMRDAIRGGETGGARLRRLAEADGMRPLLRDGCDKILAGVTSLSEVQSAAG
jgi:general secretion pathway protein E